MTILATGFLAADKHLSNAGSGQLITAALVGIAVVVLLIVWAKFHPFIALILGSAALGAVAVVAPSDVLNSFIDGLGSTFGSVGLLIALGAMLGKLLADSGGANQIVDTIVDRVGPKTMPWAMALVAGIIGLPMFFEIGVVLLVPIVAMVSRRANLPLMKLGIPALAGLSILHGLIPPHPGPETAIALLHAEVGYTLIFGLITAVPTLVIAGPLLAQLIHRWVPIAEAPDILGTASGSEGAGWSASSDAEAGGPRRRPKFYAAVACMVLPVALMLVKGIGDLLTAEKSGTRQVVDFIGDPAVALLVAILVAMVALGVGSGMARGRIHGSLGSGLPAIASIMLIVAAGGGFKQVLSDSGVADVIANFAQGAHLSVLILGWLVAVGIRLATGSATVATVTAAGIVAELGQSLDPMHLALLVLAIGSGSLFFSHVNDAGFWLVKEYFGLTVWQTIKSWSVMETVISVVAMICVLIIGQIV